MPPARPTDKSHLRYLDGWRGVAIALVLIGHFVYVPHINLAASAWSCSSS